MKHIKVYIVIMVVLLGGVLGGVLGANSYAEEIDWSRLVSAVCTVESSNNPLAYNKRSGAIGLMQITKIVVVEYNMTNKSGVLPIHMYDSKNNITVGTWYLKRLHNHYNLNSIEHILMAYNWGIGNCHNNNFDIKKSPKETREYVKKVLAIYNKGEK